MEFPAATLRLVAFILLFLAVGFSFVAADDVSHHENSAPKSPFCNNEFQLVKVKNWVGGVEGETVAGLSASFGVSLPSHAKESSRLPAVFAKPENCCVSSSSKLSNSIAVSIRGDCTYIKKAQVAQLGGAAGLLVINDNEDLYKMGCSENDTSLNITIPVLMIPRSGGEAMKESMATGKRVEILLYSPDRPVVDFSHFFLWMMAVGTIICASLWSEFIACEQKDERSNDQMSKEYSDAGTVKDNTEEEILNISAKGAIVFVITASTFLVLLYFFMSSWFIWLLIILFCIGGIEVGKKHIQECLAVFLRGDKIKECRLRRFGHIT